MLDLILAVKRISICSCGAGLDIIYIRVKWIGLFFYEKEFELNEQGNKNDLMGYDEF